jgi:hypothetical protein
VQLKKNGLLIGEAAGERITRPYWAGGFVHCLKRNVLRNIWLQEPGLPIHEGENEQTKGGCSGFTGESVTVAGQRRTLCLYTDRPPASPITRLASGR